LTNLPTDPQRERHKLNSVASGVAVVRNKTAPDEFDKYEIKELKEAYTKARIAALEQDNKDKESNRTMRGDYAKRVFNYLVGYSLAVLVLLVFSGLRQLFIADSVLSVLAGSTALAAIGLVGFVVKGLFK
jgi:hypothetical protein